LISFAPTVYHKDKEIGVRVEKMGAAGKQGGEYNMGKGVWVMARG
jgi:hypothetical protein